MKKKTTVFLVLTSAFVALTALATALLAIPGLTGTGYLNFGDAVIFIASCVLGPLGGAIVGGIGSMIADLFVAPIYAPFTLVVKGLEGFLCGLLYRLAVKKTSYELVVRIISMLIAGIWMIVGYTLSDWIILCVSGVGCSEALITAITANAITGAVQAGVSIVVALVVSPKRLSEIFSSLSENKGEGNDI